MAKKRIILHLGLPKCASTSIQFSLSKCEMIDYVGFNPEYKEFYWDDKNFAKLFDRNLRFSCKHELYWKNYINNFIKNSAKDTIVFSSENITLRFIPWDLPTHIKLNFLKKIFPQHTEFIYIIKEPKSILISLYKEWVLMGYKNDFKTFTKDIYKFKNISFLDDILLFKFFNLFKKEFSLEKINLFTLDKHLISNLENFLSVSLKNTNLKNKSIDNLETELIKKNNYYLNDFDSFFDTIELHRAFFNLKDTDKKFSLSRKKLLRKNISSHLRLHSINKEIYYNINCKLQNKFYNSTKKCLKLFNKNTRNYEEIIKLLKEINYAETL